MNSIGSFFMTILLANTVVAGVGIFIILKKIKQMNTDVQALIDEVANNTSVEASAVTLIQKLAGSILDSDDLAAIKDSAQKIHDSAGALAAAITANTPAAPQA